MKLIVCVHLPELQHTPCEVGIRLVPISQGFCEDQQKCMAQHLMVVSVMI